jgi:plastocyanin
MGIVTACQATPTPPAPSAPGIVVAITDEACPNIGVQVGQQVTWTNQDTRDHVVRDSPAAGEGQFASGTLQPGDSFAFTFLQSGTYTYLCSLDGTVTGTVTVQP